MVTRFIDIKVRSRTAERNINNLDRETRQLGATVRNTQNSFSQLSRVATAVGTALATAQLTRYADAFTSIQNQIRQTTTTTRELEATTASLLQVANSSRTEFQSTSELYTQLALSTDQLNLSTEDLLRLTQTISSSFSISGQSAAESAGAIRQLGQAFASGALRGDEFNSIAEGAPEILRALQRSLGRTAGELRAFAATGGITAEVLVTALTGAATVIDDRLAAATRTLSQSIQEANNNITAFVGSSTTITNVIGGAGDALVSASESIDTIANLAIVASSVFIARLVPAVTAYTTSLVTSTVAQVTQTATSTGLSAALGVQTASLTRATVATNILTGASRVLTTAMGFLGGPIGVAIIAATALVVFNSASDDTAASANLSSEEVDRLSASFSGLSDGLRATELNRINTEMATVRASLISASTALEQFRGFADSPIRTQSITRYQTLVTELTNQLNLLSQEQGLLVGGPDLSGGTDRGNINDEGAAPRTAVQSPFLQRLSQETEALQIELALREQVRQGFISEADADLAARFLIDQSRQEAAFQAELTRLGANEEAKAELTFLFRQQQQLTEQAFQESLTGIEAQGADDRVGELERENELKRLLRNDEISNAQTAATSALSLLRAFGNDSFNTQKAFAIADSIINITAGVAKALNNPFPANLGFAAAVAAQGAGLITTLKSTSPQSSNANLSVNASAGSATQPAITQDFQPSVTTESTALTELTNELRNTDSQVLPIGFVRDLVSAITEAQSSGQA
jgi:tape measure domain-containing protein